MQPGLKTGVPLQIECRRCRESLQALLTGHTSSHSDALRFRPKLVHNVIIEKIEKVKE